jgi:hypothetical protein
MSKPYLVAILSIGIAIGACAREAVRSAYAQSPGRYKVIARSFGPDGTESDLNDLARQGWRFSGSVDSFIVLER